MKKQIRVALTGLVLLLSCLMIYHQLDTPRSSMTEGPNSPTIFQAKLKHLAALPHGADPRYHLERWEDLHDPKTGDIPRSRLVPTMRYIESLKAEIAAGNKKIPGIEWTERGPFDQTGGRVRTIMLDLSDPTKNTYWTGGVSGGLFKTSNGLGTEPVWEPVNDFWATLRIACIAQDPIHKDTLYVGTGEIFSAPDGLGIWRSVDHGVSWEQLESTHNDSLKSPVRLTVDSTGALWGAFFQGGVQRSTDGGQTWTKLLGVGKGADNDRASVITRDVSGVWYSCFGGKTNANTIYRSLDNGSSWESISDNLNLNVSGSPARRIELALMENNPGVLYAAAARSFSAPLKAKIFFSNDSGSTWVQRSGMSTGKQGVYDLCIGVDPADVNNVFGGGVPFNRSTDGGVTWSGFTSGHPDHHLVYFVPGTNGEWMFVTTDGGIDRYHKTNTGYELQRVNTGLRVTQFYRVGAFPGAGVNLFAGGTQDNGTVSLFNGETEKWTGSDGGHVFFDEDEPNQILTFTQANVAYGSVTSGENFKSKSLDSLSFVARADYSSPDNMLYLEKGFGSYQYVRPFNNGQLVWDQQGANNIPAFNGSKVKAVRVSRAVLGRIFLGLQNGDVFQVDQANTPNPVVKLLRNGMGSVSSISYFPDDEGILMTTHSNFGCKSVYVSNDSGATWTCVEGNLPDFGVGWGIFAPDNPDQALIATSLGVWTSDDLNGDLTEWEPTLNGMAQVEVQMLATRKGDHAVYAGTYGRGIFSTNHFCKDCAEVTNTLGNPPAISEETGPWLCNLVINESDTYTNHNSVPEEITLQTFRFHAAGKSDGLTPFVVKRLKDDDFRVLAIGTEYSKTDYAPGVNSLPFHSNGVSKITLAPGETLAAGFSDTDVQTGTKATGNGAVIGYDTLGVDDEVWATGGTRLNTGGLLQLTRGVAPGMLTEPDLFRNYQFSITFSRRTLPEGGIYLDTECGDRGKFWVVGQQPEASNGQFVSPFQVSNQLLAPEGIAFKEITFTFDHDQVENRRLYVRAGESDGKIWWKINGGIWKTTGITNPDSQYVWLKLVNNVSLQSGSNELKIAYGKGDLNLDRFALVTSAYGDPFGLGDPTPDCIPFIPGDSVPFAEMGNVSADQPSANAWTTVKLDEFYLNPVVVMGPLSELDPEPATIRVRNAAADSFQFQIDEWDYLDGVHGTENISYFVMEAGNFTAGLNIEYAGGTAMVRENWKKIGFGTTYGQPPVVLAQVMSVNEGSAVCTRIRNVTTDSFEVRLREEEANDGIHAKELVGWVAIETGNDVLINPKMTTEVRDTLYNEDKKIIYPLPTFIYSGSAILLAHTQSNVGGEPCVLRYDNTAPSFFIRVQEEQSQDVELNHPPESIGYAVFEQPSKILIGKKADEEIASQVMEAGFEVRCYPNPFRDGISVQLNHPPGPYAKVELFDLMGRKLLEKGMTTEAGDTRLEMPAGLKKGYYLLRVQSGGVHRSLRVLKQ